MTKKNTLFYVMLIAMSQLTWAQDVGILHVDLARYALISESNTLSFTVKNNGDTAITSLELNWNDGQNHSAIVSTRIPAGETADIVHPFPVQYNAVVEKNITASVSKVNGVNDLRTSDNSVNLKFNTLRKSGKKAVLFEKVTGTWCQACPAGIVGFKEMYKSYKETFIGVAIHSGDPMAYKQYENATGLSGYPTGNVDRVIKRKNFMGTSRLEPFYKQRIGVEAPVDLSADVTADGSKLSIKAKANFYTSFSSAKFRLGVILTEDDVRGTSSGYAQKNAYSGGGQKMGGFENLPNPVPASKMVYDHVARALIGGYDGQRGSVPSSISEGDVVEYEFNHTLSGKETENFNLIIVLINTSNGSIVNAKEINLQEALSVGKVNTTFASLKMYPNPVSETLTISFKALEEEYAVTLYDMSGRVVLNEEHRYNSGASVQNISVSVSSLKPGAYLASVSNKSASYSQVVVVK